MSTYEDKRDRSITRDDLTSVMAVYGQLRELTGIYSGSIIIDEDATPIAEIWWDSEGERWLIDWIRPGEAQDRET